MRRLAARGQPIGVLTCIVVVFAGVYAFFKLVDATIGNRVSAEAEVEGPANRFS